MRTSKLAREEAKVLPAREALSLISTGPLSGYGVEDMSASDSYRLPDTHVSASGGDEGSVTSEDRSEHVSRTDSATSET